MSNANFEGRLESAGRTLAWVGAARASLIRAARGQGNKGRLRRKKRGIKRCGAARIRVRYLVGIDK
jgi:hypothetical protein